jgi:hypothetical protein
MKSHKLPGLHEHMHHSRLVARAPHAAQARPRRSTTRGKVGGGPLERDSFTPERGRCARRSVGAPSRFHGCSGLLAVVRLPKKVPCPSAAPRNSPGKSLLEARIFVCTTAKGHELSKRRLGIGGRRRCGPCFSSAATHHSSAGGSERSTIEMSSGVFLDKSGCGRHYSEGSICPSAYVFRRGRGGVGAKDPDRGPPRLRYQAS